MAYEPELRRFWVNCRGYKCGRWIQIDINNVGGVDTKIMPKGYHFDFETMPTLVKGI